MKLLPSLMFSGLLILGGAMFGPSDGHSQTIRFADKPRLTAADLYADRNTAKRIEELLGQVVSVEVVVEIERDVPLVKIIAPANHPDAEGPPLQAHLISVTTLASELKKGQRLLIEGVIVDEGFGAYTIYLHRTSPAK